MKVLVSGNVKEISVKQRALAQALGVSAQRVNQLVKDGVMVKDQNNHAGAVLLFDSLKNYFQGSTPKGNGDGDDVDYWEEKAKHERARRQIAELKIAKMENRVYDAKTVELVITEQLSNLRTQLLGLPSKLAPQLESMDKEHIYEVMTQEIEEKLAELSEYTPEMFSEEFEEDGDEERD